MPSGERLYTRATIRVCSVWRGLYARWERGIVADDLSTAATLGAHAHTAVMRAHLTRRRATRQNGQDCSSAMLDSGVGSSSLSTVESADGAHPLLVVRWFPRIILCILLILFPETISPF